MTEQKFETVSSMLDNSGNPESIEQFLKDEQMSDAWSRYHLIGDVLRDEMPEEVKLNLAQDIASAIAAEPTVLAPKKLSTGERLKAKVVQFSKPLGQLAIAASVTAVMIVGVQQNNVAENEQIVPAQVFQTMPIAGVADPVSLNVQQPSRAEQKQAYIEQQRRFQALLSDHNQQLKLKQNAAKSADEAEKEQNPK